LKKAWAGWRPSASSYACDFAYARMVGADQPRASRTWLQDAGQILEVTVRMSADEFGLSSIALWQQLHAFYTSLHAYVPREQLVKKYG